MHYSVPDRLVGSQVAVKLYSERIVVLYGRDKVATHARSRRSGDWIIDLMHYLGTFLRKPAALRRSVALQQVHPSVAALYRDHFRESPRSFIELLVFTRNSAILTKSTPTPCLPMPGKRSPHSRLSTSSKTDATSSSTAIPELERHIWRQPSE